MSLEDRFLRFLRQLDGAEDIDQALSEDELTCGKRADFLLDHRRIVLELKSLKADPEYKIDERLNAHRDRPEFPRFYWPSDLNEILPHLPDGKEIKHEIFHAITRSVQGALEKADDQIRATKEALNLRDACGAVALLNENIGILGPQFITAKASQMLLKTKNGDLRYNHIAYVCIISESHTIASDNGMEHLPSILLEGPTADGHPEAGQYLNGMYAKWAKYEGVRFYSLGQVESFDGLVFKSRPKAASSPPSEGMISRQEMWRRAYRQQPYLRSLSEHDFIEHTVRILKTMTPHFIVGGRRLTQSAVAELMQGWTHALEEAQHRRLDMKKVESRLPREAWSQGTFEPAYPTEDTSPKG